MSSEGGRRICVVTGSRAEYGLLYWILREIETSAELELQLAVTGTHLSRAFGLTYRQIEADGFRIDEKVDMELVDDSEAAVSASLGKAVIGFAGALDRLKPHVLLILGDRYEILAAAAAAMLQRIPIAHIHGGESTEGLIDEAVRHAVTKMSHIHCVAAERYRRRVIQMGEQPHSVHVVGAAGFDQLANAQLLERDQLEESIDFGLGGRNFLVTLHPETLSDAGPEEQVRPLLVALDSFPDAKVIITGSNADPAGRRISELLREHASQNPRHYCYRESLGQTRFLSLLSLVDVMIGNSSSGIIEAPALGTPVVNIGDRQRARLRAPAVIDCAPIAEDIRESIESALAPRHREIAARKQTPYGAPGAARRIAAILSETPLDGILRKAFYDLPAEGGLQ